MGDWLWLWGFFLLLLDLYAALNCHVSVDDRGLDEAVGLDSDILRLNQPW